MTGRSEEHTSELQSHLNLVCRLLLEKKKYIKMSKSEVEVGHTCLFCLAAGALHAAYRDVRSRVLSVVHATVLARSLFFFFNGGGPHDVSLFPPAGVFPV